MESLILLRASLKKTYDINGGYATSGPKHDASPQGHSCFSFAFLSKLSDLCGGHSKSDPFARRTPTLAGDKFAHPANLGFDLPFEINS
jgi:hypothetical protein